MHNISLATLAISLASLVIAMTSIVVGWKTVRYQQDAVRLQSCADHLIDSYVASAELAEYYRAPAGGSNEPLPYSQPSFEATTTTTFIQCNDSDLLWQGRPGAEQFYDAGRRAAEALPVSSSAPLAEPDRGAAVAALERYHQGSMLMLKTIYTPDRDPQNIPELIPPATTANSDP